VAVAVSERPPVAPRRLRTEVVHGQERRDDYFWLREKSDPEVKAYLEAENAYADAVMAGTRPLQESLYQEMLARIKETDLRSLPARRLLLLLAHRQGKAVRDPLPQAGLARSRASR
jgi:oligopeptidase B